MGSGVWDPSRCIWNAILCPEQVSIRLDDDSGPISDMLFCNSAYSELIQSLFSYLLLIRSLFGVGLLIRCLFGADLLIHLLIHRLFVAYSELICLFICLFIAYSPLFEASSGLIGLFGGHSELIRCLFKRQNMKRVSK